MIYSLAMGPYRMAALPGYRPAWALGQARATPTREQRIAMDVLITAAGVGVGLVAYAGRGTALGSIALGAAGSMVAAGVVLLMLDLAGAQAPAI